MDSSSPHHIGLDGCLDVLQQLVDTAGLDGRRAEFAQVMLAGVDFFTAQILRLRLRRSM